MSSFSIGSTNRTEIKNEADLAEVTPGSLLQIHRGSYTHWGVYIGDGKVCHLTVEVFKENGSSTASLAALSSSKGSVRIQYYTDMLCGENLKVYVNNSNDAKWKSLPPEEIIRKAKGKVGTDVKYDVVSYNCEHFANECRYGITASLQVENAASGVGAAVAIGTIAALALSFGKIVLKIS